MANGHSGAAALVVPAERTSAARARRFVLSTLEDWNCHLLVERAMLAVSELVTNVILHARTPARVVVRRQPAGVRIEVHDGSRELPRAKTYGSDATTGRGLGMVGALSEAWGVASTPEGKVVWVDLVDEGDDGSAADVVSQLRADSRDATEALGHVEEPLVDDADGDERTDRGSDTGRRLADAWR